MCIATTKSGEPCKIKKVDENGFCYRHRGEGEKFVVVVDNSFAIGPFFSRFDANLESSKHESAIVLNLSNPKQAELSSEEEGCCHVFSRGAKKGEMCGNRLSVGKFCSSHAPKTDDGNGCDFILTRGVNKGHMCGKRRCVAHGYLPKEEEEEKEKEEKNEGCAHVFIRGKNKGQKCGKKTFQEEEFCRAHLKKVSPKKEEEEEEEEDKHLHLEELRKLRAEVDSFGEEGKQEDEKEIELSEDEVDFEIPITKDSEEVFKHSSNTLKIYFDCEEAGSKILEGGEQDIDKIDENFELKIRKMKKSGNKILILKCIKEENLDSFPVATVYKAVVKAKQTFGLDKKSVGDITYNNKSVYVWSV